MVTKVIPVPITLSYPLEQAYPLSQVLFFDIETTGLSFRQAYVYLIGAVYYNNNSWEMIQWFAQTPNEEPLVLETFLTFAASYHYLFHFNGDTFDLPFLRGKSQMYLYDFSLDHLASVDLYRTVRPLKKMLKLMKLNQTTLEAFLDVSRQDIFDGGQLIPLYYKYVKTTDQALLKLILLHNHDDLLGMLQLLSLLSYRDLLNGKYQVSKISMSNDSKKGLSADQAVPQLLIHLDLDIPLPKPISYALEGGYLLGEGYRCRLSIDGVNETLKYFFPNHTDYYYLPLEDTAIHKSVASYVDKEHRKQAKASTCYCKKEGTFFPQKKIQFHPSLKKEYRDPLSYFEYTPGITNDPVELHKYINNFIND